MLQGLGTTPRGPWPQRALVAATACAAAATAVVGVKRAVLCTHGDHATGPALQTTLRREGSCLGVKPWMLAVGQRAIPSTVAIRHATPHWSHSDGDWPNGPLSWSASTGSGIVWDAWGHVVTNAHVIAAKPSSEFITVALSDGSRWRAELVGLDVKNDLAVLRMVAPPARLSLLRPLPLGRSAGLAVNQQVLAIANSWQGGQRSSRTSRPHATLTQGAILQLNTTNRTPVTVLKRMIAHSAPTRTGSSGGALLNSQGHCIGVNTRTSFDNSEAPPHLRLSLAVPVDTVRASVEAMLRKHQKLSKKHSMAALTQA